MKTGFKDPVKNHDKTEKMKSPWGAKCPEYDERSSCFVDVGWKHGVGHKQPVGHMGKPKQNVDVLPRSRVNTMKDDDDLG